MRRRKQPHSQRQPLNVTIVDPSVMTLRQAAELVGKTTGIKPHVNTVCRWVQTGARGHRLPHTRVGHLIAVRREDVIAFLEAINRRDGEIDSDAVRAARAAESKRRHRILASDLGLEN